VSIHNKKEDKRQRKFTVILFVFIAILALWTLYRYYISLPQWFDEFIAKPLLYIGPLIIAHQIGASDLFLTREKNMGRHLLFGIVWGLLYFISYTALSFVGRTTPLIFNPDTISLWEILLQGVIACSTGYTEEVVFRKYILERSLYIFHDSLTANSFTALLFMLIHLPIILFVYHYSLPQTISYLSLLFISGFIYGLVYLNNKSLSTATMTHAVWNFLGTIVR
jgi:membrane protease YdiL (CAAX protease family)